MKILATTLFLATISVFALACGGSDSNGSGGNGSSQTCKSSHTCVNGACTCDTEGKSGQSCTDEDKCEEECKVCN